MAAREEKMRVPSSWLGISLLVPSLVLGQVPARPDEAAPAAPSQPAPSQPGASSSAARATRLQGTAQVDRNHPVAGATVVARAESGASTLYLTSTDAKGLFRLDGLPEGTYRVDLRKDGFEPVVKEAIALRFPFRAIVEVTLQPARAPRTAAARDPAGSDARSSGALRLEGTTIARDGGPIADVRVRAVRADGTEDPRRTLTREDGTFEIEELSPGPWRLELLGVGYLPIRTDLSLEAPARVVAVLVPQPASYEPTPLDLIPEEEAIPPRPSSAASELPR